jgi:hypothetical protein
MDHAPVEDDVSLPRLRSLPRLTFMSLTLRADSHSANCDERSPENVCLDFLYLMDTSVAAVNRPGVWLGLGDAERLGLGLAEWDGVGDELELALADGEALALGLVELLGLVDVLGLVELLGLLLALADALGEGGADVHVGRSGITVQGSGCSGAVGAALLARADIRGVSPAIMAMQTIRTILACFFALLRPSASRGMYRPSLEFDPPNDFQSPTQFRAPLHLRATIRHSNGADVRIGRLGRAPPRCRRGGGPRPPWRAFGP